MPYVIERVISGMRLYALPKMGPYHYTSLREAQQFDTREEAARHCQPEERPVIYIEILRKTY